MLATAVFAATAPLVLPFAPVAGKPYRVTIVTERDDAGVARRFSATRAVVFARDGSGWTMTITRTGASASPENGGAMFARAEQALAGTSVRYRLDAAGRLTGIDDEAGALARIASAIDAMGGTRRTPSAKRMGDGLRALPPAERYAFLAQDARLLLAPSATLGRSPTVVPGAGGTPSLRGTVEASLAAGRLTVRDRLAGTGMAREQVRVFDAVTGLLLSAREQVEREVAGLRAIAVTITTMTSPVK